jgi:integrase
MPPSSDDALPTAPRSLNQVDPELTALLERELSALGPKDELDRDLLVFRTRSGRPIAQRNAARAVTDAASAAGPGKITPHVLRRSFCSLAGRRGVNPIEAAQMTGHSLEVGLAITHTRSAEARIPC